MKVRTRVSSNGITAKLKRNLKTLNHQNLKVGHWAEQGLHGTDDITHVDLLLIWALGEAYGHESQIKDPRKQWAEDFLGSGEFNSDPEVLRIVKEWSRNPHWKNSNANLLEKLGRLLAEEYQRVFGVVDFPYMTTDADGTPMVDEHLLKEAVAYRSSITKKITEV